MLGDGKVRSLEVGVDAIEGYQLIGGSGNDTLMNFSRITGGRGNDNITPWSYGSGGDGNDTLIAGESPSGKVTLLGDAGADTFIFRAGVAEATGGAGVDRFVFEAVMPVKINDLQAGEVIDLTALLDVSVSDAFAGGYLKQTVLKGYTYLSIDLDGGGNDYQDLATVKGVFGLADYILA
jgi:Ca2+-binding RTX toxin-like protein